MRCIAIVLGLVLVACGGDDKGTSDTSQADGVAETDAADPDAREPDTDDVVETSVADGAAEVAPEVIHEVIPEVIPEVITPSPGSFRWDLAAVAPADFYAYPWPSELRTNAAGAPDLSRFSTERARTSILADALHAVEAGPAGFSPLVSAYFGLTVVLDPASIAGNVLLVDVDRGERLAATAEWNAPGGGYWPAKTLAVHPDYQQPPPAGTRIAAILLKGLRTTDGAPLAAPDAVRQLDAGGDTPESASLRALLPALASLGLTRGDLLAWTTWHSSDPMAELRQLADWVHREPAPRTSEIVLIDRKPAWDHYEGMITLVEALSGDAPYTTPFGAGLISLTPAGAPATQHVVTIPFTLTVPRSEMPAAGYPLVLYGHGLGETHEGFLRTAAAPLAQRGVAVIGLDPPLQGTRNTTGIDDRTLIVQLSVGNIIGGREILRQGVLDYLQLAHAVAAPGFVVPAAIAPDGVERRFDATRLGFFGHSEGAQIGALLLPLEPLLGPAVFSEGGGGAAITMLVLKLQEIDVSATVAQFLGVDLAVERWVLGHPLVTAVIQPVLDAADPLHAARHILREPLGPSRPHDLVMLEGFLDPLTPPVSIEALASAIGLPIAEPVARAIAGLDAQSIGSTPLPASGNLPTVAGHTPTGALLQLPEEDHYIIYFNDAVMAQLMDFIASALAGAARLDPTPVQTP